MGGHNYHPNIFSPRNLRVKLTPRSPSPNSGKPFSVRSRKGAKFEEGVKQTILKALGIAPLAINVGAAEPKWEIPLTNPEEGWNFGAHLAPAGSGLSPYDIYFDAEYILSAPGKTTRKIVILKAKAEKGLVGLDVGETEIANTLAGACCDIEIDGRPVLGSRENQ